jgi:site-specific DNA-methyltransferase (adenine-specific)
LTKSATEEAKRWDGYGTALKPSWEPIIFGQKPIKGTIAANVLDKGVGALNIDACRIGLNDGETKTGGFGNGEIGYGGGDARNVEWKTKTDGRWPANVILQHHSECVCEGTKVVKGDGHAPKLSKGNPFGGENNQPHEERYYKEELIEDWVCHQGCPISIMDRQSGTSKSTGGRAYQNTNDMFSGGYAQVKGIKKDPGFGDKGGASRFFYQPKVSKKERTCEGRVKNEHPTVKPINLMEWLISLVCPHANSMGRTPLIIDCFVGSGSTAIAAHRLGVDCIGIDADEDALRITRQRLLNDYTLWEGMIVPCVVGWNGNPTVRF